MQDDLRAGIVIVEKTTVPEFVFTAGQERPPEWIVRSGENHRERLDPKQLGRDLASRQRAAAFAVRAPLAGPDGRSGIVARPGEADHFWRAAETLTARLRE